MPDLPAIVAEFVRTNGHATPIGFESNAVALLRFVRDHVHPGDVFGDRVAFVPGVAEAACDVLPFPTPDAEEADGVTITRTDRAGLADQLAEALSDGDRVALIVTREQLAVMIEALEGVPRCRRQLFAAVADVLPPLRQLFAQAFAPPG